MVRLILNEILFVLELLEYFVFSDNGIIAFCIYNIWSFIGILKLMIFSNAFKGGGGIENQKTLTQCFDRQVGKFAWKVFDLENLFMSIFSLAALNWRKQIFWCWLLVVQKKVNNSIMWHPIEDQIFAELHFFVFFSLLMQPIISVIAQSTEYCNWRAITAPSNVSATQEQAPPRGQL
jgi:hypothetical protein